MQSLFSKDAGYVKLISESDSHRDYIGNFL